MDGWEERDGALERTYEFGSFAEAENHHPDFAIAYRKVTLRWVTHSAGGITARDRELAGRSDELV